MENLQLELLETRARLYDAELKNLILSFVSNNENAKKLKENLKNTLIEIDKLKRENASNSSDRI